MEVTLFYLIVRQKGQLHTHEYSCIYTESSAFGEADSDDYGKRTLYK